MDTRSIPAPTENDPPAPPAGGADTRTTFGALVWLRERPILGVIFLILTVGSFVLQFAPEPMFGLLPAIGVLFLLLLAQRPDLGFLALVLLIPFGGLRKLGGGGVQLNLPWIIAFALIALLWLRSIPTRRFPGWLLSPIWFWLIGWLLASLASAAASEYTTTAFRNVALLLAAILFVGLGMILLTPGSMRAGLPAVIVGGVSFSSALGLLGFSEMHGERLERSVGGAMDPNNLALMILYALPFVVYGFYRHRGFGARIGLSGLLLLNLAALVSTYSRSGVVMLGLAVAVVAVEYRGLLTPRNIGLVVPAMLLAAVAGVLSLPDEFWERGRSLVDWRGSSLSRRASYLNVAAAAVPRDPVLGAGPGAFRELYVESEVARAHMNRGMVQRRYAHNTYLEVLVGTGLVGLTFFLGALGTAWLSLTRTLRRLEAHGRERDVYLVRSYRASLVVVAAFLAVFSDVYHKDLLLSLATSQVALRMGSAAKEEE